MASVKHRWLGVGVSRDATKLYTNMERLNVVTTNGIKDSRATSSMTNSAHCISSIPYDLMLNFIHQNLSPECFNSEKIHLLTPIVVTMATRSIKKKKKHGYKNHCVWTALNIFGEILADSFSQPRSVSHNGVKMPFIESLTENIICVCLYCVTADAIWLRTELIMVVSISWWDFTIQ